MSANIAVVREAAAAIAAHPEHHNQSSWCRTVDHEGFYSGSTSVPVRASNDETPHCGTTLCWAGWIAFQQAPEGAWLSGAMVHLPDAEPVFIEDYAREAAGLSESQAHTMFHWASDEHDVAALARALEDDPDAEGWELREAAENAQMLAHL